MSQNAFARADTLTTRHQLALWSGMAGDAVGTRDAFAALLPICERVLGAEPRGLLLRKYEAHSTALPAGLRP